MFLTKVVEKIKTCILCSITFFKNRATCEIIWENIVKLDRPQMTVWCMHIACWIPRQQHTLWIYSTYCFFTATVVARMCVTVNVTHTFPVLQHIFSLKFLQSGKQIVVHQV